jgi:hypothetical protein
MRHVVLSGNQMCSICEADSTRQVGYSSTCQECITASHYVAYIHCNMYNNLSTNFDRLFWEIYQQFTLAICELG